MGGQEGSGCTHAVGDAGPCPICARTAKAMVDALKVRHEDDLRHMPAVRAERGRRLFYDRVRTALGRHNPDGDASEEQLCEVIARLVTEINCLPTPNAKPAPEPT